MNPDISEILNQKWYYSVELRPGEYTKGFDFKSIAVTRKLLDNINVSGALTLDMSTMEGLFSVLLSRRGAKVLATDSIDLSRKINVVKEAYGVQFEYFPNTPLERFSNHLFDIQCSRSFSPAKGLLCSQRTPYGFDIVISSGVMYHVLNPVDHLCTYRKLCKSGGLLVLETACAIHDEIAIFHDLRPSAMSYGGNATWFISTAALDLYMRACFLEPIAFCYLRSQVKSDIQATRLGVIARAVDKRPFNEADFNRLKGTEIFKNYDFKGLYQAAQLTGRSSCTFTVGRNELHDAAPMNKATFAAIPEVTFKPEHLKLSLADK